MVNPLIVAATTALLAAATSAQPIPAHPTAPSVQRSPDEPSELATQEDATPPGYRIPDTNLVYFGNPKKYKSPAAVSLGTIFKQIAPYQELKSRGLGQADGDYWILLNKTNAIFEKVLTKVLEQEPHDLIAEVGAIKVPAGVKIPVITDLVLEELKKGGF